MKTVIRIIQIIKIIGVKNDFFLKCVKEQKNKLRDDVMVVYFNWEPRVLGSNTI